MTTVPSLFWLLCGGALQIFGFGKWMVPLAAWLAPVFLLHFSREADPVFGILSIWIALFLALSVSNHSIIPLPRSAFLSVMAISAASMTLPFLADRLAASPVSGFLSTLIFPVVWTATEFLTTRLNPFGTWGSLGYTQHANQPLMQLASLTGILGIAFLICWFAAVLNWAWDRQFEWGMVFSGVLFYAAVWGVVMVVGAARMVFAPRAQTVRIAGIGWPGSIIEPKEFLRVLEPDFTAMEREQVRATFSRVQDSFFERSLREAKAGAKIIVWPEANLMVLKEDEAAFLKRAGHFARDNEIFLLMGMATLEPGAPRPVENKSLLLNAAGETEFSYRKITAVPGFEARTNIRGKEPIPVAATPYGRVAAPICFDLDFPQLIRQIGRAHVDLMLVPASDWKSITHLHQIMAEFRAIENGAALFRITRWGGSGAVDPYGRRLATMDDFMAQDNVMVAQVPVAAGVRTTYARVGDLFAWLCVIALLGGIAWASMQYF